MKKKKSVRTVEVDTHTPNFVAHTQERRCLCQCTYTPHIVRYHGSNEYLYICRIASVWLRRRPAIINSRSSSFSQQRLIAAVAHTKATTFTAEPNQSRFAFLSPDSIATKDRAVAAAARKKLRHYRIADSQRLRHDRLLAMGRRRQTGGGHKPSHNRQ